MVRRLSEDLEAAGAIGRNAVEPTSPFNHRGRRHRRRPLAAALIETGDGAEARPSRAAAGVGETDTGPRLRCSAAATCPGDGDATAEVTGC